MRLGYAYRGTNSEYAPRKWRAVTQQEGGTGGFKLIRGLTYQCIGPAATAATCPLTQFQHSTVYLKIRGYLARWYPTADVPRKLVAEVFGFRARSCSILLPVRITIARGHTAGLFSECEPTTSHGCLCLNADDKTGESNYQHNCPRPPTTLLDISTGPRSSDMKSRPSRPPVANLTELFPHFTKAFSFRARLHLKHGIHPRTTRLAAHRQSVGYQCQQHNAKLHGARREIRPHLRATSRRRQPNSDQQP